MNATNVDYYIVGFKSDGSRAAGKICMFDPIKHPDKLKAEAEKMKADNADIVTVKAATTADYMNLLGNNEDGKEYILSGDTFVPKPDPVITDEEKKAAQKAALQSTYESDKATLEQYYLSALASGDTDTQSEIQSEIAELDAQFDADIKALD